MTIEQSIKIKNYKCFGEKEQGFDRILPINIIIGKNNSGKTALLELVEYLCSPAYKTTLVIAKAMACFFGLHQAQWKAILNIL